MKYLLLFFLFSIVAIKAKAQVITPKPPTYKIGDTAFCGMVFYIDSLGQHGLVCTLDDQSKAIRWYNGSYITTFTYSDYLFAKGSADTIISVQKAGSYAATACANLNFTKSVCPVNDSSKWYLPSRSELRLVYKNLVVTKKLVNFAQEGYWCSTELKAVPLNFKKQQRNAWIIDFRNGREFTNDKVNKNHARAVRAF